MIPVRQFIHLLHISSVLSRYRLDEVTSAARLFRPMRLIRLLTPRSQLQLKGQPRGARIRLALQELGPVFVKFGQILSTRRDLLPLDIGDELALLQDHVAPFPGELAVESIESALQAPVNELFSTFELEPLASASVAQVHAATLDDGSQVVVKVLRPGIERQIERDLDLIRTIAAMAERYWAPGKQLRPTEIVAEFEKSIFNELDLVREAANASQLRRNFEDSAELYIPSMHWPYCKQQVMVMERVNGIPINDMDALRAANVNLKVLSTRGLKVFYTQVFQDNFFHADMHPGNILVDASNPDDPTLIALDFGIVGTLPPDHLYYMGENFAAIFAKDYRRVAVLHIESGWVPDTVRVDELESAVRVVCEPQFARPLAEISFAEVLFSLFRVARQFNLVVQPELVMLQKTLLNIEGLGRELYPDLDMWDTAKPILENILRQQHGLDATARDLRDRLPSWLEKTPEMPGLIYNYLNQATTGGLPVKLDSSELRRLREANASGRNRTVFAIFAAGLCISASVLIALESPISELASIPIPVWALLGLAAISAWRAWPKS